MTDSVADTNLASPVVTRPGNESEIHGRDPEVDKGKGREEERDSEGATPEPTLEPVDKDEEPRRPGAAGT